MYVIELKTFTHDKLNLVARYEILKIENSYVDARRKESLLTAKVNERKKLRYIILGFTEIDKKM